eukprot:scaffold90528_cov68-Phaeocystis_antarctica.AAC.1
MKGEGEGEGAGELALALNIACKHGRAKAGCSRTWLGLGLGSGSGLRRVLERAVNLLKARPISLTAAIGVACAQRVRSARGVCVCA